MEFTLAIVGIVVVGIVGLGVTQVCYGLSEVAIWLWFVLTSMSRTKAQRKLEIHRHYKKWRRLKGCFERGFGVSRIYTKVIEDTPETRAAYHALVSEQMLQRGYEPPSQRELFKYRIIV